MSHKRFAIYYLPPEGPLATFGAAWLGWDIALGRATPQFSVPDLDKVTQSPRKYGFHGTLKPPFRLGPSQTVGGLEEETAKLAARLAPARCDGLQLSAMGRFLALTPVGDPGQLQRVASACVRELDGFRAPSDEVELARRRKAGLSERQNALLARWGYPHVMEAFWFHMTLTVRLPRQDLSGWMDALRQRLPEMPSPFVLDQIALCGERADGQFQLIRRYSLCG